jgi:hypothetical protein
MPGEASYHFDNVIEEEEEITQRDIDAGYDETQSNSQGAAKAALTRYIRRAIVKH